MARQNLPIIDTGPPIRAVRSPIFPTRGNVMLALCAGLLVGWPGVVTSAEFQGRTASIAPLASSDEAPLLLGNEDLFVDERTSMIVTDDTIYSTHSPPGAESWDWWILPEGLLYKSYIAGEKEPRFSTAFLAEKGGDVLWDTVLGGRVGVVRYGTERGIQPEGVQLDLEGGAFVRLLPEDERDVNAVDFRFGVPLTYREGPFQAKFGYYHISSHLGDEFLLKNPGIDRINYVRDALVLGIGYFPIDSVRLYAETSWAFFTGRESAPWDFQTGLEWSETYPTGIHGAPFFAMNIHLREETDWSGSLNILAGWQWRGFVSDHVFRAALQYYTGKNNQYSFTQDNQQLIGLGIRYDY